MKNKTMIFFVLIALTTMCSGFLGCDKQKAESTDQGVEEIIGDTETIDSYIESKGYKVYMNSGIGFDIYLPEKERETNKAFLEDLISKSMLNGYDFSNYLNMPLQYTAMAIEGDDHCKDISFLSCQGKIVGVWEDSSDQASQEVKGKLLQYNFVYGDAEELLKYQSAYLGDNSNVGNLVYALPHVNGIKPVGIELQTTSEPYEVSINCLGFGFDENLSGPYFKNAAVIFSLIDNVGIVNYHIQGNESIKSFQFTRLEIEEYFQQDVRKYAKSPDEFKGFLQEVLDYCI